jgi:hypothetical protein
MFGTLIGGLAIYAGGKMRDAHLNVSLLFQCAAAGLLVCAVLMLFVKPRRAAESGAAL